MQAHLDNLKKLVLEIEEELAADELTAAETHARELAKAASELADHIDTIDPA